ncbi:hypothetical protein [Pseudaquidulcibacter saccharophilus]|uniref:hypothetical protein n=1 Tax=Pseudaquidulcibacter saccharophilus TaxID=2831900 RepID=UPI001EFF3CF5|nr:hypothetical protein [Pseudaquidulcibacter saccharophilus]
MNASSEAAEKITESPEFFLELAKRGESSWNSWRNRNAQEHKENGICTNYVNFENFDFSSLESIPNFSHFNFGEFANFKGAKFGKHIVSFVSCGFGNGTDFSESTSDEYISFSSSKFSSETKFNGVNYKSAIFENTSFQNIECHNSKIENANFKQAHIGGTGTFINCKFVATDFYICVLFNATRFYKCHFVEAVNFVTFVAQKSLPKFQSCVFEKTLDISGRDLDCDFTGSIFHSLPKLLRCENHSAANFHNVKLKITSGSWPFIKLDEKELINIRLLRKIAEETKNHDLERDLYIEERRVEQGLSLLYNLNFLTKGENTIWEKLHCLFYKLPATLLIIFFSAAYGILSNYGRSIFLPAFWYFISFILFSGHNNLFVFKKIWENRPKNIETNLVISPEVYNQIASSANLANHIPIVGQLALDSQMKRVLFCGYIPNDSSLCLPPSGYDVFLVFQNIFVGILIFLFGLAIRNYFKIK